MAAQSHSCDSAAQTLAWITAIVDFLQPYKHLLDAHVVNFFKDRLWESIDDQWIDCLRKEPVEYLVQIPSGFVMDYWPSSLKEFSRTLRSLVLPRDPNKLRTMLPNLHVTSLGTVLSQGMNLKKKHEVEILAAVISAVAKDAGAHTIIDVGAGQGYLAQVLSFEYQLSVLAVDASSHHGSVTSARAERIKKHYAAKIYRTQNGNKRLNMPEAVTCNLLSSETLKAVTASLSNKENCEPFSDGKDAASVSSSAKSDEYIGKEQYTRGSQTNECLLLLAGLHACGDLSVTMLRTFLECKEAKAVVSIGCCYNLLSEDCSKNNGLQYGFPISNGSSFLKLWLGRNGRDLACQSAERWRSYSRSAARSAAIQNFEVHAFRAAFQMVLREYYPDIMLTSPSIGRQGKSFRRQQLRKSLQSELQAEESVCLLSVNGNPCQTSGLLNTKSLPGEVAQDKNWDAVSSDKNIGCDNCSAFKGFCKSGLSRLGLELSHEIDLDRIWREAMPFLDLIGPYWSVRAALGPLVETLILLDRLLFLQEQGESVEATIVPLFNPTLSPRNLAIVGRKI